MRYSLCLAAIVAATTAAALPAVSQISDGQIQAATGRPVAQISDGQVQAAKTTAKPVQQISDGQVQAPKATGMPVQQISDGQVQAPKSTGKPVQQISDGQVQAPKSAAMPVQQISDGQIQAPKATGMPVQQISDGQIQAPKSSGKPVMQISDGQIQAPKATGMPVMQISDGQIQAPKATGMPVMQISDGQIQAPKATGKPVMQISDGQIQAPKATGAPVMQISDGQIQAPKATGSPVMQISDGQLQVPSGKPVQQISDGQLQVPKTGAAGASATTAAKSSSGSGMTTSSGYGSYNPTGNSQVPFKFPLDNGFPNIMVPSSQLTAIQKQAHGTLPNGALPKKLSDASATTFQVIAFNEIFEVAYFSALLKNISSGIYNPDNKDYVVEALTAVQGQEELHALGANAILASAGRTPIQPCQYKFPVSDFSSAIATASLFTDVVLGTLQSAQSTFSSTGDGEVIGLVSSIIGQEGEQDGYYRAVGKKIPSALPFLSASAGAFAFSALNQLFVVPGTCGNLDAIKVPILEPLTVMTPPGAADSTVTYSYPVSSSVKSPDNLRLVLINQQNAPIVQKLDKLKVSGNTVTFTAPWPYTANLLNGLTIATVTNGPTTFANVSEVANAAVWGPGLIEVN